MARLTLLGENPWDARAEPTWAPPQAFFVDRSYVPCAGQRLLPPGQFSGGALGLGPPNVGTAGPLAGFPKK